jgi:hypothetical protein
MMEAQLTFIHGVVLTAESGQLYRKLLMECDGE